jgi:formate-dependent nitrite reductase membrane component NrfD
VTTSQQTRSPVGRDGKERRMVPPAEPRSYYGRPVIKEPTWTPEVPVYFFMGGMAGASAGLAFAARLTGRKKLARAATGNAFAGVALSPPLLISDLGVPTRFLNMLRVFKVTSPMSVGSWILSVEGGLLTVTAAHEFLGWFPKPLARLAGALAALFGMPLATYTAALIANTSVPVWHEARGELPFAFAGGSAMAAGGAASLLVRDKSGTPARRLAIVGSLTEVAATQISKKKMGKLLAEPYSTGAAGRLEKATMAATGAAAVALTLGEARRSRRLGALGSALAVLGSMLGRWMVYKAGFQSAAAPQYTVEPQRARRDAGQSIRPTR